MFKIAICINLAHLHYLSIIIKTSEQDVYLSIVKHLTIKRSYDFVLSTMLTRHQAQFENDAGKV